MSLVPTYVEDQQQYWYIDPVIRRKDWFICWDDDEPIELVVKRSSDVTPVSILHELNKAGWNIGFIADPRGAGSRLFTPITNSVIADPEFHPALRGFLQQKNGPPTRIMRGNPSICRGRHTLKHRMGEGVIYYNGDNGWKG